MNTAIGMVMASEKVPQWTSPFPQDRANNPAVRSGLGRAASTPWPAIC
jgi:hypothetical protein